MVVYGKTDIFRETFIHEFSHHALFIVLHLKMLCHKLHLKHLSLYPYFCLLVKTPVR